MGEQAMTQHAMRERATKSRQPQPLYANPFATRYTRPGALPFMFPAGSTLDSLLADLAACRYRAQIVGPHGTGKSTLLKHLVPRLEAAGFAVPRVRLRVGQRRLPGRTLESLAAPSVLVVDGCEQLGLWSRRRLFRITRRKACGLLITSHKSCGLPTLIETRGSVELLHHLVAQLTTGVADYESPDQSQLARILTHHRGNIRESLFALYDLYEQTARKALPTASNSQRAS